MISFYADRIIKEIGDLYSLESMDDYREDSYNGKYEGYGLSIKANADHNYNFNEISIKFYGREVYNDKRRFIIEGTWQELLKELYYNIPEIQKQRHEEEEKYKKIKNLYNTILSDLFSDGPNTISDSLRISVFIEYDVWAINDNGTIRHQVLLENNKEVFHAKNGSIVTYKPGNWENEVIEYYRNFKNHETEIEKYEALKQIKQLRKIKKYSL